MKIVHHVRPSCTCREKIRQLVLDLKDSDNALCVGTIVECDCGQRYKLIDDQRDGEIWQWHHPDSGDMGKR